MKPVRAVDRALRPRGEERQRQRVERLRPLQAWQVRGVRDHGVLDLGDLAGQSRRDGEHVGLVVGADEDEGGGADLGDAVAEVGDERLGLE